MSKELKEVRKRRPAARRADIITCLMEERLSILESSTTIEQIAPHAFRLRELLNELQRSLNKNAPENDTE